MVLLGLSSVCWVGAFGLFVALYGPLLAGSRGGAARSVGAAGP